MMKINRKYQSWILSLFLLIPAYSSSLYAADPAAALTVQGISAEENYILFFDTVANFNITQLSATRLDPVSVLFVYSNGSRGFTLTFETDHNEQGIAEQGVMMKYENGAYSSVKNDSTQLRYTTALALLAGELKAQLQNNQPFQTQEITFGTPMNFNADITGATVAFFKFSLKMDGLNDKLLAGNYRSVITLTIENL